MGFSELLKIFRVEGILELFVFNWIEQLPHAKNFAEDFTDKNKK